MYAIAKQERIGVDVVSGGELYTALSAGFPAEKIYLHGNNKLPKERAEALDAGIGGIVVDAYSEADALDEEAAARNMVQDVLIRVNPGVEAHTHAYVQTATPDSKFGFSVADGAALAMTRHVLSKKHLRLRGFTAISVRRSLKSSPLFWQPRRCVPSSHRSRRRRALRQIPSTWAGDSASGTRMRMQNFPLTATADIFPRSFRP